MRAAIYPTPTLAQPLPPHGLQYICIRTFFIPVAFTDPLQSTQSVQFSQSPQSLHFVQFVQSSQLVQ
jgi:hypothetical protein